MENIRSFPNSVSQDVSLALSPTSSAPFEEMVLFLLGKSPLQLGITKLMKLLFLADMEHMQLHGERLCDIDWTWHRYGPFSPRVYQVVESLGEEGLIQDILIVDERRFMGADLFLEKCRIDTLAPRQAHTLERVIDRYGSLALPAIKQVAYATATMRSVETGMQLDVSREPQRRISESLAAFRELKMRAREPDLREWGDPNASAAEDTAITDELSGLLHDANSMH
jgi:uncharacterized phage-associated protein